MKIRLTLIACICALVPATAVPQALTSSESIASNPIALMALPLAVRLRP